MTGKAFGHATSSCPRSGIGLFGLCSPGAGSARVAAARNGCVTRSKVVSASDCTLSRQQPPTCATSWSRASLASWQSPRRGLPLFMSRRSADSHGPSSAPWLCCFPPMSRTDCEDRSATGSGETKSRVSLLGRWFAQALATRQSSVFALVIWFTHALVFVASLSLARRQNRPHSIASSYPMGAPSLGLQIIRFMSPGAAFCHCTHFVLASHCTHG